MGLFRLDGCFRTVQHGRHVALPVKNKGDIVLIGGNRYAGETTVNEFGRDTPGAVNQPPALFVAADVGQFRCAGRLAAEAVGITVQC